MTGVQLFNDYDEDRWIWQTKTCLIKKLKIKSMVTLLKTLCGASIGFKYTVVH